MMEVFVIGSDSINNQEFIGTVQEIYKEDGEHYIKKSNCYISEESMIQIILIEKILTEYKANSKIEKILKKFNINFKTWRLISGYYGLNRKIPRDNGIYKEHKKIKMKYKKDKKKIRLHYPKLNPVDSLNIEEFKADYISMSNKELCKKYNVSAPTLWLWSKQFKVKRPKIYYSNVNVKNTKVIEFTQEMDQLIYNWGNGDIATKNELKEKLNVTFAVMKRRIKELGVKKKKKEKLKTITKKEIKKREQIELLKSGKLKCSKCGEIKSVGYFHKEPGMETGYHSNCKDCKRITKWSKEYKGKTPTIEELKEMKEYFNNKCAYCSCDITPENYTLDHVIPRAKGGMNSIDNIVLACFNCNTRKYTIDLHKFINPESEEYKKIVERTKIKRG